jgi:hypothetical protein
MWFSSAIRILGNRLFGHILKRSQLWHILNDFENNLGWVLVFWACFNFSFKPSFENILILHYFCLFVQMLHEKVTASQPNQCKHN